MFTDGPQAGSFVAVLDSEAMLVVPVISILEVFKWVLREHSETQASRRSPPCRGGSWWISTARSRSQPPSSADVRRTVSCAWQRGSNLPGLTSELGLQVLQTSAVLLVPQAAE